MRKALTQDSVISLLFLIIITIMFIATRSLIPEAAIFPYILMALLLILTLSILKNGIKRDDYGAHGDDEEKLTYDRLKNPMFVFFLIFIYCVLITIIGFFPSTLLFVFVYLFLNDVKSIKLIGGTMIGVVLFIYWLFVVQLNVKLPTGIFF